MVTILCSIILMSMLYLMVMKKTKFESVHLLTVLIFLFMLLMAYFIIDY